MSVALSMASHVSAHSCRNLALPGERSRVQTWPRRHGAVVHGDTPYHHGRITKSRQSGFLDTRVTRKQIARDVVSHASVITPYMALWSKHWLPGMVSQWSAAHWQHCHIIYAASNIVLLTVARHPSMHPDLFLWCLCVVLFVCVGSFVFCLL